MRHFISGGTRPCPIRSRDILSQTHPYDSLPAEALDALAHDVDRREVAAGEAIYTEGQPLDALYLVLRGRVDVTDASGEILSILGPGNSFGERGLMRDGRAVTSARAAEDGQLLTIPAQTFRALVAEHPRVARFFDRTRPARAKRQDLTTMSLDDMMTRDPLTVPPETGIAAAARKMRDNRVSSLMVTEGDTVAGIVTTRDLTNKALAEGLPHDTPVRAVMTANPVTLPPSALVSDVLHAMVERRITHMPVVEGGKLVGMLTQTDLTRFQATSSAALIQDIAEADTLADLAATVETHSAAPDAACRRPQRPPGRHPADHRCRRRHHAAAAGDGRGEARPAPGALPVAGLRQPGPAGTDRHQRPG